MVRLLGAVQMTQQEKKKIADPKNVTDAVEVAEDAGLRYVSDDQPGYTRKAKGDDFEYFDAEGKPIRDEQRLLRIKRLAIPPAYTDVWICPPSGSCYLKVAKLGHQFLYER